MLRRNVLLFHQAALGDFVLTWPIALAVARIMPQARVIYVTAASKGKLAEAVLRVESTDAEQGWHRLLEPDITLDHLPPTVARWVSGAHTALVFGAGVSSLFGEALRRLQPDFRLVELSTDPPESSHLVDSFIEQTASWVPLHAASQQILGGIRERGLSVSRSPTFDVLIHPGSGGRAKRWPLEAFVRLAREVIAAGRSVQFCVGPVEMEHLDASEHAALAAVATVLQPSAPTDLLHAIATARTFVGNDSGPTHLAAIVGTPTVALFGPSDPRVWSPLGPNVCLLRSQPLSDLRVEDVLNAVLTAS